MAAWMLAPLAGPRRLREAAEGPGVTVLSPTGGALGPSGLLPSGLLGSARGQAGRVHTF